MSFERIDWVQYFGSRLRVTAASAEGTILKYDCPLCGDSKSRGWVALRGLKVGCFNGGCPAEDGLEGGAVALVQALEGLSSRGRALSYLIQFFPALGGIVSRPERKPVDDGRDWCKFPEEARPLCDEAAPRARRTLYRAAEDFAKKQWGLLEKTVRDFQLHAALSGRFSGRILIPIARAGTLAAFQARSYQGREPKYLSSTVGRDCARGVGALLFNADAIAIGVDRVILVEGPGDAMALAQRGDGAVAVMGMKLSATQIGELALLRPQRVCVALDAQPAARARALFYIRALREFGLDSTLGRWVGGKDAGSGARLEEKRVDGLAATLRERRSHVS